jgi:hypothetical protein
MIPLEKAHLQVEYKLAPTRFLQMEASPVPYILSPEPVSATL